MRKRQERGSNNQYTYKTKECLIEHQKLFHTTKNKNNEYVKDAEYRMEYKKKDHRWWSKKIRNKLYRSIQL